MQTFSLLVCLNNFNMKRVLLNIVILLINSCNGSSSSEDSQEIAGSEDAVKLAGSASDVAVAGETLAGSQDGSSESDLSLEVQHSIKKLHDRDIGLSASVENMHYSSQASEEPKRIKHIGLDYFKIDSGDTESREKLSKKQNDDETKQYLDEKEDGDITVLLGTNPHLFQSESYPDFSRRFVLQYPYTDISSKAPLNEAELHLIPKLAPPELVLAIANESAILNDAMPANPTEELINKKFLRNGNYWNAFWKEDVDPKKMLRTNEKKLHSITAKVLPDADIYQLVAKLKKVSPKLLYVINKSNKL